LSPNVATGEELNEWEREKHIGCKRVNLPGNGQRISTHREKHQNSRDWARMERSGNFVEAPYAAHSIGERRPHSLGHRVGVFV